MRIHRHGQPHGPALVLIHGLSSSHRVWQRNLTTLGERHRLLAVELFSPGAGPRFDVRNEALRLATALAGEPCPMAVMGHSLGGLVAMELAVQRPDLVERLVLVDVPALRPAAGLATRLRGLLRPGVLAEARSVGIVALTLLAGNPLHLLGATTASARAELSATAAVIRAPTLLVWGARDAIVPAEIGARLAALMGAELRLIPRAGHQPQWEAPEAFHAAVLPFLVDEN